MPPKPEDTCPECGYPLSAAMRHCPTCNADVGFPNVRMSQTLMNKDALNGRYSAAQQKADLDGHSQEFRELGELIKINSGVVISMSASVARSLFEKPSSLYANYERLVGSEARTPAIFDDDRHRSAVGALLFGSYAEHILYGALSLTSEGLPTYGDLCCRLKKIAIEKRTSFLESNSYKFVKEHKIKPDKELPSGFTACWEERHLLVLAKLSDQISTGQTKSDWQKLLIRSDGQNREYDEFVEAHIYGTLNGYAVESVVPFRRKKLNKTQQLDMDLAIEMLNNTGVSRP